LKFLELVRQKNAATVPSEVSLDQTIGQGENTDLELDSGGLGYGYDERVIFALSESAAKARRESTRRLEAAVLIR